MALCRAFSKIFNCENFRDPEIPVKGESRSLNVVPYSIDWVWFPIP